LAHLASLYESLRAKPTKKKLIPAVITSKNSFAKLNPALRFSELTETLPFVWQCGQIISGFFDIVDPLYFVTNNSVTK
jgi:hypothetical protein